MKKDIFKIDKKVLKSRLIVGTGKYKNLTETAKAIKSSGASSMKDMGKVMGVLKSKHADTLDFSKVSSFIKELLNKWSI